VNASKAPPLCAGIDRWRGGWVIAERKGQDIRLWTASAIAEVCEALAAHAVVAIDMPIALANYGRREAESELRAVLGSAARSVFTSPTRPAVAAESQSEATILNRKHGGPGISAQAFGLFASIRELRSALSGPDFAHWWETHPETAFALMNRGEPMASKRTAVGVAERLAALETCFPRVATALLKAPHKVPIDDALDALAALWSAERIARGAEGLYGPGERDDEGFALGIRV